MKKDLLILHGAIGSAEQFSNIEGLLKDNFNVHLLNFSGHGGKKFENTFSIESFAKEVLDYLNFKKIESINIFGYSMGGYVGLYLAKTNPEKVSKLFTFATKFEWNIEIAEKEIKMLNPDKIHDKIPAFAKQLEARHKPNDWKEVLEKTSQMIRKMGENPPLKLNDYESIKHQTMITIGDKDTMVTLKETIDVYRSLPNAQLAVFPNTTHPIEKVGHERLANEIICFFSS